MLKKNALMGCGNSALFLYTTGTYILSKFEEENIACVWQSPWEDFRPTKIKLSQWNKIRENIKP